MDFAGMTQIEKAEDSEQVVILLKAGNAFNMPLPSPTAAYGFSLTRVIIAMVITSSSFSDIVLLFLIPSLEPGSAMSGEKRQRQNHRHSAEKAISYTSLSVPRRTASVKHDLQGDPSYGLTLMALVASVGCGESTEPPHSRKREPASYSACQKFCPELWDTRSHRELPRPRNGGKM
jgi:hypothetical protein